MKTVNWSRTLSVLLAVVVGGILLAYGFREETPVGTVRGKVTMTENGKPLPGAEVILMPQDEPSEEALAADRVLPRTRVAKTSADGTYSFHNVIAGLYTVRISSKAHEPFESTHWVTEGEPYVIDAKVDPIEPYLRLYVSQKVFTPDEQPRVEVHGFTKESNFELDVYKLKPEQVAKFGGIEGTISPIAHPDNWANKVKISDVASKVTTLAVKVTKRDAEGTFVQPVQFPLLSEGLYYVDGGGENSSTSAVLNVTRIALVTKTGDGKAIGFVTDIKTGKPVAGAVVRTGFGNGASSAVTNTEGLADLNIGQPKKRYGLLATYGNSVAVVGVYGYDERDTGGRGTLYGYTDRPIYRPGDLIQFKAIVRRLVGSEYQLPDAKTAEVEIFDGGNNMIEKMTLPVTAHGTLYGKFKTSPEATPGNYSVRIKSGELKGRIGVDLAAYRKPDYAITVKSEKPYYVMGDRAKVKVHCAYYFGGPVVGANVEASTYRSPDWSGYGFGDDEDPYEGDTQAGDRHFGGGEFSQETQAVTDAEGNVTLDIETKDKDDTGDFDNDFTYSVNVSVADVGDKYFSGTGEFKVVRGDFNLGVSVDRRVVDPEEAIPITIKTTTPDDKHPPIPGRAVSIQVGRDVYTRNRNDFVIVAKYSATTGQDGLAHVRMDGLKSGSYTIKAIGRDDHGRSIGAIAYLYVSGDSADDEEDEKASLSVTLDRRKFDVGDQARVLISSNVPGGSALLTVEADSVMYRRVINLDSKSKLVNLPIAKEFAPNAYLTVSYVHDRKFLQAERRIVVDRKDRNLTVSIGTDKAEYLPGGKALVTIKTTDHLGKPVPAELSLAVVDESIYAIQSDTVDLAMEFYPQRGNSVQTNYSFPEIYLDGGDKGEGDKGVRKTFLDTAFWQPTVETGPDGTATVPVTLPDNLTEWRITARGVTDATVVGQSTSNFIARKPLMVRVLPPGFLVQGDSQHMAVQVINHTGQDADVNLSIVGSGIDLDGAGTKKVHVAKDGTEAVDLVVNGSQEGTAQITAKAWIAGGAADGEQKKFEVLPHGRLITQNESGELVGSAGFDVNVLPTAATRAGRLKINLSPSVATAMAQSLDDLVQFPYGCVEQTLSRFVPAVQVTGLLKGFGLSRPDLEKQIPQIAFDGYARLGKMQHPDGGWGWWENDKSDAYMTALVLDGIDRAKTAGYAPRFVKVKKAQDWLAKSLKETPVNSSDIRDRLYGIWVLARYHRPEAAAEAKALKLSPLGPSQNALAALAYNELGPEFAKQKEEALATLTRMAEVEGSIAHWQEEWWSWGEENSGLALSALIVNRPNDPLIAKGFNYLMRHRQGDMWSSTRATAFVLDSLCRYLKQSPPALNGREITVLINGKSIKTVAFTSASLLDPDLSITVPIRDLQKGRNHVEIRATGEGTCYYSADLRQYDVRPKLDAIAREGISVKRDYYVMKAQALKDGSMQLLPSNKPIEEAQPGDIIKCVLRIDSTKNREFMMIEDPIPSNCRVTDREDPISEGEEWGYWWCSMVIRDDRVAYFARRVEGGNSEVSYTMRVEGRGAVRALPTTVTNMYDPAQSASSADSPLRVAK